MRSVTTLVGTLALGALVLPAAAYAQQVPSPFKFIEPRQEAGFFTGVISMGTGQLGFGPESGPFVGARYSLRLGGPFSVEGVATAVNATRDVIDPTLPEGGRVVAEADALIAMFEARLRFQLTGNRTWHGLIPFILVGGGFAREFESDQAGDELIGGDSRFDFGSTFVGTLGGGLKASVGSRFFLRADVTSTFWQLSAPLGYQSTDLNLGLISQDEWVQGFSGSIGLSFIF